MQSSSFLHALKWSTAGELASRVLQPVVFIILAKLLTPEDYGVMAAAVMIISFTNVFWEAGMGKALIQRQTHFHEASTAAFWINVAMSVFFIGLLLVFANSIAIKLFHDARVSDVIRVMTIQIILGALASVPTAILQKQMKFRSLFWVRILTVTIPALFSIPLALAGWSYWAIVAGTLFGQLAQVLILTIICKWKPSFSFNKIIARELIQFGLWVSITGLLVWFFLWADSLVVGAYLGTHDLGLFRTANTFVLMLFDVLFSPLLPVLYSYFSGMQHDREKIKQACMKIVKGIAIISIPLSFLLFALAEPFSQLFFGDKWKGIGYIISLLGIMRGYGWLVGINGEIYRALGRPQYETFIYAFSCIFFLAGYIISIQYGFREFIITRLSLGMASLIPHFYLFRKIVHISLKPVFRTIAITTMVGMLPLLWSYSFQSEEPLLRLFFIAVTSILSMGISIFFLERKFVTGFIKDLLYRQKSKMTIEPAFDNKSNTMNS
ncbi:MAG TPA: lipopolysaccharide biosynthesis protein [Flavitalea sp.]|nr:lipopolysaccharide biosynthesis protein [Flavitalea sp.]